MKKTFNIDDEPEVNPDIELFRIARELARERYRNEYDLGFHGNTKLTRKQWVDEQMRREGLL